MNYFVNTKRAQAHKTSHERKSRLDETIDCEEGRTMPINECETDKPEQYVRALEARLAEQSDELEQAHMEAAIDFQFYALDDDDGVADGASVNESSVSNCLSPFVPTRAEKIEAFLQFASLTEADVLLDIGCGDGRVCIATAKARCCRLTIGLDVSPLCIDAASKIVAEEGIDKDRCRFYQADATVEPSKLLDTTYQESEEAVRLAIDVGEATILFLYVFPSLMERLIPLLRCLFERGKLRAVVTLTYHIQNAAHLKFDEQNDMKLYTEL
jgi:SAM-dependent methyltransferase